MVWRSGGERLVLVLVMLVVLAGCAGLRQAKADLDLSTATPAAEGEILPPDQAQAYVAQYQGFIPEPLKPIAVPFLAFVLTPILGVIRGRKIRLGQERATNPITGWAGAKTGVEGLVQTAADANTGVTELFPEGTVAGRIWKIVLAGVASGALISIPAVNDFATQNYAVLTATFTFFAALVAGVQKALSHVKPNVTAPA